MRHIIAFSLLSIVLSCGFCEFVFTNIPQRYIEREVEDVELVGLWTLTQDSEARIIAYIDHDESRSIGTPWKTISVNPDGTCQVKPEMLWITKRESILNNSDIFASCTWKSKEVLGSSEDGTSKKVPGVFLRFERFNNQTEMYEVYYTDLFISEENNELILWSYIGNPANVKYQDFKKTKH